MGRPAALGTAVLNTAVRLLVLFLCAVDFKVYDDHPHLRDLFVELASEVALNRERKAGDSVCLRVREPLPKSPVFHSDAPM